MDDESNSCDSGDGFRSSAVISVAQRRVCFASLVDELSFRIHSLGDIPERFARTGAGIHRDIPAVWASILNETDAWWLDHLLGELTTDLQHGLIGEVFRREPLEAAVISVGVFSGERLGLLTPSYLQNVQSWSADFATEYRAISQALALMVLAPWFADKPSEQIEASLVNAASEGRLRDVSSTLLTCVGLLQLAPEKCAPLVLGLLLRIGGRSDFVQVDQFGGLVGRLWSQLPTQVEQWLEENCARLPRRVFRLAIERLPAQRRVEFTELWKTRHSRCRS